MNERQREPVLTGTGLTKSYGGTPAIDSVDIMLHAGERQAVTGENGAGKSTLIKVLGGIVASDSGRVIVGSGPGTAIASPKDAREAGVAIVHQHLSLIPQMSIEENCVLPRFPASRGLVDRRQVRATAEGAMAQVGLDLDPRRPVEELSFAERQLLEIGRALLAQPQVLILDEPTSALTPGETERLFQLLLELNRNRNTALLYVSHRIGEIYALTERATVLRDGKVVGRLELADHPSKDLVAAMVGRDIDLLARREPTPPERLGPPVLQVRGLSGSGIDDIDLEVRGGEICAVAGLVGAGRSELARHIFGIDRPTHGTVSVAGRSLSPGSTTEALHAGVGFVPEDRHRDGIALALTTADNAIAPSLDTTFPRGWLSRSAWKQTTEHVLVGGDVRPPDPGRAASSLSGGNQQKIVIGKWLARPLRLLILDEPTAGVDIEAKNQIHRRLAALAAEGLAVLLISSDLPEVLTLADRIVVMSEGRIVGELLPGDDWTEERVIQLATGEIDTMVIEVI